MASTTSTNSYCEILRSFGFTREDAIAQLKSLELGLTSVGPAIDIAETVATFLPDIHDAMFHEPNAPIHEAPELLSHEFSVTADEETPAPKEEGTPEP